MTSTSGPAGGSGRRIGPSPRAVGIAVASLLLFIVAFVLFMLAPLLLIVLVAGTMWGYERYNKGRALPAVRRMSAPRSLREAGSTVEPQPDAPAFAFGRSSEEGL